MENQFFDEECIQDCMNLPKSIKIEMLKHAEDDLNKQGLLLADLIFNEYKYVEIFNNDCVYFVNENERFKHLNLDEAFDLAMEIFED